ncbi:CASP-like protein 3A2 [Ziziphus jujuba]|uniref:CASP-like protein n=1 Tax=Ziziphus jujuba TaxID=326968 RepID=A0ABM3IUV6_ZIZJJ|nr:CASP-like protein 3A2 [Ziziphus jujuba]
MVSGRKTTSLDTEVADEKVVVVENGTTGGSSGGSVRQAGEQKAALMIRKADVAQVVVRLLCMSTSLAALLFMVTAKESSTVSIYGFSLPVYSKWSFSDSFEYLVGVSAAVAAHSLLQLLLSTSRLLRKSPVIPSRNHAWLLFAGDQLFAYAMMSAGSAASGVSNLNRTGIRHTSLPNFCKTLQSFCDHVAISIAFTFFGCFLLAVSAIQDVIWLSNN